LQVSKIWNYVDRCLCLIDKLLAKDVAKERITQAQADEARGRLTGTTNIEDFKDVDFVIEAVPVCNEAV
jgi:3-hydroxybutyryl-CoA dehydrogenase